MTLAIVGAGILGVIAVAFAAAKHGAPQSNDVETGEWNRNEPPPDVTSSQLA